MKTKIVIIGGGPAGYTAAMEAADAGMEVTLIEKNLLGGVCVNHGCLPTKVCLQELKRKEQYGLLNPVPGVDTSSIQEQWQQLQQEITGAMRYNISFMLDRKGVTVLEGVGRISGDHQVTVALNDGGEAVLECDHVVVATGSAEKELSVAEGHDVYLVDDFVMLDNCPEEISVMGAGVSGVELAVIMASLGSQVHLIEKEDHILPGWDEEIRQQMEFYLTDRGIKIHTKADKPETEAVVLCTGREAVMPETAVEEGQWIHGAGDCVSSIREANVAMEQAKQIICEISGRGHSAWDTVVKCIYTPLEAASAGITMEEADIPCVEFFYPITRTASGMMDGLQQGFIKVIMEEKSHVLRGFHMMSTHASEVIMIGQIAVEMKTTAEQFAEMLFPHPTEAELLKEAVCAMLRGRL